MTGEIDVSGLSLIDAEKAFRTFHFCYESTSTITPARGSLEHVEEVDKE